MRRGPNEGEGGEVVLLLVLGLALMVGVGYLGAYVGAHDKVPRGTSVAGVKIGGQDRADAARLLRAGMAARMNEPITVTVGVVSEQITPVDAGIEVDYVATVAGAGGVRALDPKGIWDYYDGGDDVTPVLKVNLPRLRGLLAELSAESGTAARDGAVSFDTGRAVVTEPKLGAEIDVEPAADLLAEAWAKGDDTVALPLRVSKPKIDAAELHAAIRDFANPALSGPVTLVFADSQVQLFPRDYSRLLRLKAGSGRLVPDIDAGVLADLVKLPSRDGDAVDATVALADGVPQVVPETPGATYDPRAVREAFLTAVAADPSSRAVEVKSEPLPAEFTTRDARQLKIHEEIGSFTLPAGTDADLQNAAAQLSGTVLRPGETLSLNDAAGPAGAQSAALATAAFNAAYDGGLGVTSRTAPTAPLYGAPLGREATITWGTVDLQLRNDSEYGVLFDASAAGDSVRVTLWSTKQWDVSSTPGQRLNVVPPTTVKLRTPDCQPAAGSPGYEVEVTRTITDPTSGEVVTSDTLHSAYVATDRVVCKAPAAN